MVSATIWRSSASDGLSPLGHDPGNDPFTPFGIGALPHHHLFDPRVRDQDALHHVGPYLLGPRRDRVVHAARDHQLPVGTDVPGVSRGEPVLRAVGSLDATVPTVPVAAEEHRGADQDLAFPGRVQVRAAGSARLRAHGDLHARERGPVVDHARAGLGHPVRGHDVGGQRDGHSAAAEEDAGEDRRVDAPECGRHESHVRGATRTPRRLDGVRIKAGHDDERGSRDDRSGHDRQPPDVRQWQAGEPRVPARVHTEPGRCRAEPRR